MSSKPLKFTHIHSAAQEALNTVDGRRKGTIKYLKTRWGKLNRAVMDGIEWNCIFTIGGISGSGKSAIADEMETSLIDLNPNEKIAVLSFNWEMIGATRVMRKTASKTHLTVKQLQSADQNTIDDHQFKQITAEMSVIAGYPVWYVDTPGTPEEVLATFIAFKDSMPDVDKFVIFLDHTLFTRGKHGEDERKILSKLQDVWILIKKHGAETKEYSSIIFQLSQLNRAIESQDRVMSLEGHYPKRGDLFGGDSVYQASDYVLISHRPELLYIQEYGPEQLPVEGYIYWHLMKARNGEPAILQMINNLKYNKVDES